MSARVRSEIGMSITGAVNCSVPASVVSVQEAMPAARNPTSMPRSSRISRILARMFAAALAPASNAPASLTRVESRVRRPPSSCIMPEVLDSVRSMELC